MTITRSRVFFVLFSIYLARSSAVKADVHRAPPFGSNMVLQRDVAAKLVGWADAGEAVSIKLGGQVSVIQDQQFGACGESHHAGGDSCTSEEPCHPQWHGHAHRPWHC